MKVLIALPNGVSMYVEGPIKVVAMPDDYTETEPMGAALAVIIEATEGFGSSASASRSGAVISLAQAGVAVKLSLKPV